MTNNKQEFQKELKETVKEGIKPSDLKKLKKSKSLDDLSSSSSTPPLQKSKSQLEIPLPTKPSKDQQISNLQDELTVERKRVGSLRESLSSEQEKNKQATKKNQELKDHILELRFENIQDFGKYREQLKVLVEEIETAANELVKSDQSRINLQVQNKQLLGEKKDLEKRLQTANQRIQQLYQMKGLPNAVENNNPINFWSDYRFLIISLLTYWLIIWWLSKNKQTN